MPIDICCCLHRYCADADSNVHWKQLNSPLAGVDQGKREFRRRGEAEFRGRVVRKGSRPKSPKVPQVVNSCGFEWPKSERTGL